MIDGYVNAVERFSKVLRDKRGKFIEKIRAGVFQKAIDNAENIKVLLDHDEDRELADTKSGKAKIFEDNIGLRCQVEITDKEVIEKAKQNKLKGWSFGFICLKEDRVENEDSDIEERTIRNLILNEVSIIDDRKTPAYIGTSIEVRSDGDEQLVEYRTDDNVEVEDLSKDTKEDEKDKKIDYSEYEKRLKICKER